MSDSPCISVIMPVYNAGKYVGEAVQSILDQSFTDFEFIIINDGSTDGSLEIIQSFTDKRIKILNNLANIGNYPSRNRGLRIAKGKYICIMDADDISLPHRFERQTLFMDENPDIGLAGSGYRVLGGEQDLFRESDYEKIKVALLRNNCFIHPSVIIRHEYLKGHALKYISKYYYSSDYDFIARAARFFPVTNIHEVLMHYRVHEGQVTMKYRAKQVEYADEISVQQLRYIGVDPDEFEIRLHTELLKGNHIEYSGKQELYGWINKILKANQNKKYYQKNELESFFDALLSLQPFCRETTKISPKREKITEKDRTDLSDVTFVIPLRIDSQERIENIDTVVKYISYHFKTTVSILEADSEQRYFPGKTQMNVHYRFVENRNGIFHKTHWVNQLISMADTPYVVVWDADAIVPKKQIIEGLEALRSGKSLMSIPYDGRAYSVCEQTSRLFKETLSVEILNISISAFDLMHGYYMTGGIYMVNKKVFIKCGGENEKILGWGLEDAERLKRMGTLNLPIYYSKGPLFHLWHPRGKNSWFANRGIEKNNRKEFLKTCSLTN